MHVFAHLLFWSFKGGLGWFFVACCLGEYGANEDDKPESRLDAKAFWGLLCVCLLWPLSLFIGLLVILEKEKKFFSGILEFIIRMLDFVNPPFAFIAHIIGMPGRIIERKQRQRKLLKTLKKRKHPHENPTVLHSRAKCVLCDKFPSKQFEQQLDNIVVPKQKARTSADYPIKNTIYNRILLGRLK